MASPLRPLRLPNPTVHRIPEEHQVHGNHSLYFPEPCWQLPYERKMRIESAEPPGDDPLCFELPFYFRAEVLPEARNTECVLVATSNKRPFDYQGDGDYADGVTAYASVDRTCFSIRLNLFRRCPRRMVVHNYEVLKQGEWNELGMAMSEERAVYWINGVRIATAFFNEFELPASILHVGFVSKATGFKYRNFDLSRDPLVINHLYSGRVITLTATATQEEDAAAISVSCTAINGEELAILDVGRASQLLPGTRVRLDARASAKRASDREEDESLWWCWRALPQIEKIRLLRDCFYEQLQSTSWDAWRC
eukprot:TRINITY_DN37695_c0_g1_i3.p1 TRINITY_DN37695_c0_g1~~TRINITY_DN37695_c0_g1_i3.p1  ORF type:complete len:309 (-),score=22.89 TRINITY_DN37695_c0_g1_i3:544-1470(-)